MIMFRIFLDNRHVGIRMIYHTFVTKFGFILRYIHHNVISWENDLENSVTGDFSV